MNSANRILVTGGAGYIGSHVVLALREAGWHVTVIDDLSSWHRDALPGEVDLVEGDVGDQSLVDVLLARPAPVAVILLAGSISVPESVRGPLKYYTNNTGSSHSLIARSTGWHRLRASFTRTAVAARSSAHPSPFGN